MLFKISFKFFRALVPKLAEVFQSHPTKKICQHIKDIWYVPILFFSPLFEPPSKFNPPLSKETFGSFLFFAPNLRRFSRRMAHGRAVAMLTLMGATEWPCTANTAYTQMPDFDCLQDIGIIGSCYENLSLQQR